MFPEKSVYPLMRLEKHLKNGTKTSKMVLQQWVKRYGDPARTIIRQYRPELEL